MKAIKEIEKVADRRITELDIWSRPAHVIISTIYNLLYELFYSENGDSLTHRFKAERIVSYLSGISPYLSKCSDAVVKIRAEDAAQVNEEIKVDIRSIIEYGQICTVMDRVHKGEFCETISDGQVSLHFKDEEAFSFEAEDVLISELSLPHFLQPKNVIDLSYVFRLGSGEAHFEPAKVAKLVADQRKELGINDNDIEYLDDFSDVVLGVSNEDYRSLKSSVLAFAIFIESVSKLLQEAIQRGILSGAKVNSNLIFWRAPCLKRSDLISVLAKSASVAPEIACAFVDNFSMTVGKECPRWVKGGYFPPFQVLGERVILSPVVLLVMVSNRNAIYVCSKKNEKIFHNVVSQRMEPKLVKDFVSQLPNDGGWEYKGSIDFPGGEIDLVCFHAGLNLALQIQAKGSIAPEGAVLVRNFESRCEEGVDQLRRFEAIPRDEQLDLLGRKFPAINKDTVVVPCLLARGSFGRPEFLQRNSDILFLNPFLAKGIFSDDKFDWSDPARAMGNFRSGLVQHVDCVSNLEKFSIFEHEVHVELPIWDRSKLNELKIASTLLKLFQESQ